MTDLPIPNPIAVAYRRTGRRALVPADTSCQLCDERDADLLEDHHVLGVAGSDTVRVWLCRNCHRRQTIAQHDLEALPQSGRYRPPADTTLERIARALRSLAVFVHALAHWLTSAADQLFTAVAGLDALSPSWRTQEWAR